QFVVNKDGTIHNPEVLRGIGYGCDKEAVRLVNKMPNWVPGEQREVKVNMKMILPIRFSLE
ncbi:MAG: energy transducer TonB, partial [Flavobacteriales bacterium]